MNSAFAAVGLAAALAVAEPIAHAERARDERCSRSDNRANVPLNPHRT